VRLPYILAPTAVLIAALTWMFVTDSTSSLQEELRTLDQAVLADSELHRDVLSARAGMLRNYDPLVREERDLRAAVELLRAKAADADITTAADRLAELAAREEEWMEQFKSDNALLHNSLAYFELFGTSLIQDDGALMPQISALDSAMLHLTLDTSPSVTADVESRLAGISSEGLPATDADLTRGLVTHGRMLLRLLPETDNALKSLFAVPSGAQQQIIREMVLKRQHASEIRASRTKHALFGISLILVLLLLYAKARLRARARALRQRAALERMIAGISTRFISARPYELAGVAERALEELAEYVGADRAYFHGSPRAPGRRSFTFCWCRGGVESVPQWPQQAMALAQRFAAAESSTIDIGSVDQLPPGADKDVFEAAGVRAWLCIPASGGPNTAGILGFDTVRSPQMVRGHELGLLRMVADAFMSAAEGKCLELERERLETKLQAARRMEVVGALTSGIAHNFNNIIGAILGYTETAQAQLRQPTRLTDHLSEIRRAGERARDLVQHILTFGRRRAMRRTQISVQALIEEAKSMLNATLPERVRLVVQEISPELFVSGEASQLQQVIVNLCNNAAQAMDATGDIEIEVTVREMAPALLIEPGDLPPGSYVVISVTDPGRGMDEATLERIFEPFFTTRLEGNGLGLATVREIVLEHAGSVNVQSTPEAGTRFDVWLPNGSFVPDTQRSDDSHAAGRGNGETILVLESDRARLLRHEEILAALGYEPAGFTRLAAARAACLSDTTHFDAAILCAHLNGMAAALEHAATLQTFSPGLPVILATPSTREWNAPALAEAGIAEIIHQPLSSAELASALARSLHTVAQHQ
jgi:signal transduction histidine kinase/CheY-like chemotaxis protein